MNAVRKRRDNSDVRVQRKFVDAEWAWKQRRAIELAADLELTRSAVAKRLRVDATTVGAWWREAAVRLGDGRKEKGM